MRNAMIGVTVGVMTWFAALFVTSRALAFEMAASDLDENCRCTNDRYEYKSWGDEAVNREAPMNHEEAH